MAAKGGDEHQQTTLEGEVIDEYDDGTDPKVLTVVTCGESKQTLDDGETVPARELYSSPVHTCKDRYGRHSHGYYIASAKFGLVHNQEELPYYDQRLGELTHAEKRAWADDVASDLREIVDRIGFDAVVIIGGEEYIEWLEPHFESLEADVLTPWQTSDEVGGVGEGLSWYNDESNWPVNVCDIEQIGKVVSPTIPISFWTRSSQQKTQHSDFLMH